MLPITASGTFGPFCFQNPWTLLARREALKRLQSEGIRGLKGCRTQLRFRQKKPPTCWNWRSILTADCTPVVSREICHRLAKHVVGKHSADLLVASERFVEAVRRLDLGGIVFRELALR